MSRDSLAWIGLAGVSADDTPRALEWQRRLHGVMIGVALLALPAYVLDTASTSPSLRGVGHVIDALIAAAFTAEAVFMASLSNRPGRYLLDNWLNVIIIASSIASVLGAATEWVALTRMLRVATAGLVFVRTLAQAQFLFTRRGAPALLGVATTTFAAAGAMFYWLEPDIHSYWDGVWLAFITGATVGYGDLYPRTGAGRAVAVIVVLAGWAYLSLFTANIVALFLGRDEQQLRREMHGDIRHLRNEIVRLEAERASALAAQAEELARIREDVAGLRATLGRRD
jgi:voltage-gated potassium channel